MAVRKTAVAVLSWVVMDAASGSVVEIAVVAGMCGVVPVGMLGFLVFLVGLKRSLVQLQATEISCTHKMNCNPTACESCFLQGNNTKLQVYPRVVHEFETATFMLS